MVSTMRKNGIGMKAAHMLMKAHEMPTMGLTPVTLMNTPDQIVEKGNKL